VATPTMKRSILVVTVTFVIAVVVMIFVMGWGFEIDGAATPPCCGDCGDWVGLRVGGVVCVIVVVLAVIGRVPLNQRRARAFLLHAPRRKQ